MLQARVLTAVIGLPAIVLSIALGPAPFAIFLAVVAGGCAIELSRLTAESSRREALPIATIIWTIALATRYITEANQFPGLIITAPLLITLLLLPASRRHLNLPTWAWTVSSVFYIGWLMGYWGGLYLLEGGASLVLFGLLVTFSYDTSAYFVGRALGRRKLAPTLSSGKTWEGVVGGLTGAVLIGTALHLVLPGLLGPLPFEIATTIGIAAFLAVTAQAGDLVESALKRSASIKDAGSVLPGHGGMLDRFDSVLFTGTVLYYVSLWLTA